MLETLGNIGDFLGGTGVLVSLIYLAIQIRQSTTAGKANSYQAVVSSVSDWSRDVAADPELCRVIIEGSSSYANLAPVERLQFNLSMSSFFRHMENVHAKYQSGSIDAGVWEGWALRTRAFLLGPGTAEWWQQNQTAYSTAFREWVAEPNDRTDLPQAVFTYSQPEA